MKALRPLFITILFVAGAALAFGFTDYVAAFKTPVDLYGETTNVSDISKTTPLTADIYAVLDCFVEETTTTKNKNGSVTKKEYDYYYIIPAYNGDETYYIGIKVPDDKDYAYDEICELTWQWMYGETENLGDKTVHAEGCLKKMNDEMYGYMVEWFEETEWFETTADIEKYVLPMYFEPLNFAGLRNVTYVCGGAFAVSLILFVLSFVLGKKKMMKAQEQTCVVINGISYQKELFENVNRFVANKENVFAIQELCQITGLTPEEAQPVIHSWHKYYL